VLGSHFRAHVKNHARKNFDRGKTIAGLARNSLSDCRLFFPTDKDEIDDDLQYQSFYSVFS
jgi:hypothetical protein